MSRFIADRVADMSARDVRNRKYFLPAALTLATVAALGISEHTAGQAGSAQTPQTAQPVQFGGNYSSLDSHRQHLIDNWVARFGQTTGQRFDAASFYDDNISLSAKTTFDAITHALRTTALTDTSGASLGDALALVERVDSVHGEVSGSPSDHQFRMYGRLTETAFDVLAKCAEFTRTADNTVFHKGYPVSYRGRGGTPSIQISVSLDHRSADIDVDYRSSTFPTSLFNGHLTASNSDVRAGNNYDRHTNRWVGFQSWWRNFFGLRSQNLPPDEGANTALSKTPRIGKKEIDVMVNDFLNAWLIEGDIAASMAYVSNRSYACLTQDSEDPSQFDRGMAPFQLMMNLKSAHDALGSPTSLEGVTIGVRYPRPYLKVVSQPRHAQFVLYSVPDDIAAQFDCQSRLSLGNAAKTPRVYGQYYGATFYIKGRQDHHLALLWAKENGYWKIVSWETGEDDEETPVFATPAAASPQAAREKADLTLVQATRAFLDAWLVRRDYDTAFRSLSARSYACYDLVRGPDAPAAASMTDAGQRIRTGLQRAGEALGPKRALADLVVAVDPVVPSIRAMDHAYSQQFTLSSLPDAIAGAMDCAARVRGDVVAIDGPPVYGKSYGMSFRFMTLAGDTPVLRAIWTRENGAWRITAFDIDTP